jgi:hypothetical protein
MNSVHLADSIITSIKRLKEFTSLQPLTTAKSRVRGEASAHYREYYSIGVPPYLRAIRSKTYRGYVKPQIIPNCDNAATNANSENARNRIEVSSAEKREYAGKER